VLRTLFFTFCWCWSQSLFAQQKVTVSFVATYKGQILKKDSVYISPTNDSFAISKLKCYVSNFSITSNKQNVQLVDFFGENSFVTTTNGFKQNKISFYLGVDSALNCSGPQAGALDPLNNMFWTWHSGYIFFKLEGSSSSLKKIEQHIGGYKAPYVAFKKITIPLSSQQKNSIVIAFDIEKYWAAIVQKPIIGAPSANAVLAANTAIQAFSIFTN
jgi:hypothetical protein